MNKWVTRTMLGSMLAAGFVAGCRQQSAAPTTPPAMEVSRTIIDFEDAEAGQVPAGFVVAMTSEGGQPQWAVQAVDDAYSGQKVLAQTSTDKTTGRYPLCVYQETSAADVTATVAFKAIFGEVDQAGGIAIRYQDKDNYYVVRANALENNVRLYKVVNGQREQFAGVDVPVPAGQWHILSITATGSHFTVTMNGQFLFAGDDATITAPGKVALWTKADSVTQFDGLMIVSGDPAPAME